MPASRAAGSIGRSAFTRGHVIGRRRHFEPERFTDAPAALGGARPPPLRLHELEVRRLGGVDEDRARSAAEAAVHKYGGGPNCPITPGVPLHQLLQLPQLLNLRRRSCLQLLQD